MSVKLSDFGCAMNSSDASSCLQGVGFRINLEGRRTQQVVALRGLAEFLPGLHFQLLNMSSLRCYRVWALGSIHMCFLWTPECPRM